MNKKIKQSPRVLVFGGTIEGRRISDYLVSNRIFHTVCVATEYGEEVLSQQEYLEVHRGRMDMEQMRCFMSEGGYTAVVDATHPYAVEVSKNVRAACEQANLPYLRYLRPYAGVCGRDGKLSEPAVRSEKAAERITNAASETPKEASDNGTQASLQNAVWVNSTREAAEYLETQEGQIFLTTGSKELHIFTEILTKRSRIFARVLPSAEVIASCRALGLEGKQICGMQGPFSADINEAMLRQTKAAFLVTKDTGISGGFPEKLEAAGRAGVSVVIIRRPEEAGCSWEEVTEALKRLLAAAGHEIAGEASAEDKNAGKAEELWCEDKAAEKLPGGDKKATSAERLAGEKRTISCIGIGMGTLATLTHEAAEKILGAQIVFGAKRILESARDALADELGRLPASPVFVEEYIGTKIASYLDQHPQYCRAAVLMSGDVGFYSGARGIGAAFPPEEVRYYCGISSIVYFASKIPTAWQDAKLLSAHGKQIALLNYVCRYPKIILLVSGAEDVERICAELAEAGMDQVRVTVGTNLSYPEETIRSGAPSDFLKCTTTGLHIMMLENKEARHVITPGIPDEEFVRGKVPMTKEEIRALSVAKLRLTEDAVVYDVGAGTGSVSVECARLCTAGRVYAIERKPEGISLIRENSRKMQVSNVIPVEGLAPQALEELPAPTHAFIGGSSGNMKEIIQTLRGKNPEVRVVINTIALESIAEVTDLLAEFGISDADIVQVAAAKSRVLGRYHMMTALNPVYIISFGGL